ncbi:phage tail assembly protein [Lentzea sp. NEAU-D7]|uniref:phage tail assembly protein n=1 Tax=Lentzea sp. NEAU-D7 TaxID=2994667 RepID=UPI00224B4ACD|nr:phage tail assembly protein [Lentzea sp. NEAU-D7]MCX2954582.1 phage tail assembly protein [Lentzea sp. NEAU-D7]
MLAGATDALRIEYPFTLPRGYVDDSGQVHRDGVMRLATARDELVPQNDQRVRENPAYLSVLLLQRTVTRLGSLPDVSAWVVENLFASDLAFLQDLYRRINQNGHTEAVVECPSCGKEVAVDIAGGASGGS